MSKPTIADVARLADVSTATVSRALKHPGVVSKTTRQRVQDAVQRINYVPNSLGRSLRTQRSGVVILVVRDIGNPFYLEIFQGVEAAAHEHGLAVLMGNVQNDAARERRYFDMVRERAADGMILMTGQLPADYAATAQLPIVVALEHVSNQNLPTVMVDNVTAAREAILYLIELGHRRIAHVAGPTPEVLSVARMQGYREALRAANIAPETAFEIRGDYSMAGGKRAATALLSLPDRPTAIFCSNDEMAMGVIAGARELGLTIPADLSVVGFDDIVFARSFAPALTTVHQPRHDIGVRALQLLVRRLHGQPMPEQPIVLPTRLAVRASTAAPKTV